jgi:hypothetical protein
LVFLPQASTAFPNFPRGGWPETRTTVITVQVLQVVQVVQEDQALFL